MTIPIYQVDAFTDQPFAGNPAAVCVFGADSSSRRRADNAVWMQQVAGEMNLSETAFISPIEQGCAIRYFTPTVEVPLCGHATLASAHVLWESGIVHANQPIQFDTIERQRLVCVRNNNGLITMDFPVDSPATAPPAAGLIEALGVEPSACAKTKYDWLIELTDQQAVIDCTPDFAALSRIEVRGVIITAKAEPNRNKPCDFVSRFFAPVAGIDEDPVTGSAHCALAPYWANKLGGDELVGRQLSKRGGTVNVRCKGDRVEIAGRATTIFTGALHAL